MKLVLLIIGAAALLGIVAMGIFVFVVQSVETPEYGVVESDGAFEIREYPALVVAETTRRGVRREALGAGFGPLARYIFAKERDGERIAMTAPVIQQRPAGPSEAIPMTAPVMQSAIADDVWSVSFIMPSGYSLERLPAPATTDVRLREIPARRRAAVRFSGAADDAALAARESLLRGWIAERGLTATGAAIYAYYNDPLTPGFLRRNEVLIDIETTGPGAEVPRGEERRRGTTLAPRRRDAIAQGNADPFGVSRGAGCPTMFSGLKPLNRKDSLDRVLRTRADVGHGWPIIGISLGLLSLGRPPTLGRDDHPGSPRSITTPTSTPSPTAPGLLKDSRTQGMPNSSRRSAAQPSARVSTNSNRLSETNRSRRRVTAS